MSLDHRLRSLELRGRDGTRPVFHRCTEHDDLPWEQHVELHRQLGEYLFTMDLGAADVREDV